LKPVNHFLKEKTVEKQTPLFKWHETHGGKIVPFAGYALPVQYETGVITEHNAVREHAGLFDVSHMGEFVITGPEALTNLQHIFTGDFTDMGIGRVRYTLLCNDAGSIIDDLVVCKLEEQRYFLVVNAANRDKDAAWIQAHLAGQVTFEDISDTIAQIALQGPASVSILTSLSTTIPQKYYTLIEKGNVAGIPCIVSRTGYTGETGFEFYCKAADAETLWEKLLEAGKDAGLIPCGLGARDTLRLEAAMPLYGHEMDETVMPFEAALSSCVAMTKPDFIGKAALTSKETPVRVRVGLQVMGRGIARGGEAVFCGNAIIGKTTSGTFCPYIKKAIAMALVKTEHAVPGTTVEIDVRGKKIDAVVVELPFYKRGASLRKACS
jgi:aminomethyltransferase